MSGGVPLSDSGGVPGRLMSCSQIFAENEIYVPLCSLDSFPIIFYTFNEESSMKSIIPKNPNPSSKKKQPQIEIPKQTETISLLEFVSEYESNLPNESTQKLLPESSVESIEGTVIDDNDNSELDDIIVDDTDPELSILEMRSTARTIAKDTMPCMKEKLMNASAKDALAIWAEMADRGNFTKPEQAVSNNTTNVLNIGTEDVVGVLKGLRTLLGGKNE